MRISYYSLSCYGDYFLLNPSSGCGNPLQQVAAWDVRDAHGLKQVLTLAIRKPDALGLELPMCVGIHVRRLNGNACALRERCQDPHTR